MIQELIQKEIRRQNEGITLIPSENYASKEVLAAMGTPLSNKYSEGYPFKRYYGGNEFIDKIEEECITRAKTLFSADHANVQPHSGSQANAAVYLALLNPGDKVLGFSLVDGGHLTHGSPVNFSSKFYNFTNYGVNKETERIDYDEVERLAIEHQPKLIIASTTAYSRRLDFKRFKEIADKVGAYLFADIAHIAGLVVAGEHPHPFPYCDVVSSTTHKTLRGPRGGLILCKKELADKIDKAVFPGMQGGPLDHVVAAKAICFEEAMKLGYKQYIHQVVLNANAMSEEFINQGFRVVSGGTDNHMFVLDLTGYNTKEIQDRLDSMKIYVNRNTIPFDPNPPYRPSGIRIGTPAVTTRGFREVECIRLAELISKIIKNEDANRGIKIILQLLPALY